MGSTQPYTAFPVIEDAPNNAKGFTSRILWYFPKPVFAALRESILAEDECDIVTSLKEKLGKSLHPMTCFGFLLRPYHFLYFKETNHRHSYHDIYMLMTKWQSDKIDVYWQFIISHHPHRLGK